MPILAEVNVVLIILAVVAFIALLWGLGAWFEAKRRKDMASSAGGSS